MLQTSKVTPIWVEHGLCRTIYLQCGGIDVHDCDLWCIGLLHRFIFGIFESIEMHIICGEFIRATFWLQKACLNWICRRVSQKKGLGAWKSWSVWRFPIAATCPMQAWYKYSGEWCEWGTLICIASFTCSWEWWDHVCGDQLNLEVGLQSCVGNLLVSAFIIWCTDQIAFKPKSRSSNDNNANALLRVYICHPKRAFWGVIELNVAYMIYSRPLYLKISYL